MEMSKGQKAMAALNFIMYTYDNSREYWINDKTGVSIEFYKSEDPKVYVCDIDSMIGESRYFNLSIAKAIVLRLEEMQNE